MLILGCELDFCISMVFFWCGVLGDYLAGITGFSFTVLINLIFFLVGVSSRLVRGLLNCRGV